MQGAQACRRSHGIPGVPPATRHSAFQSGRNHPTLPSITVGWTSYLGIVGLIIRGVRMRKIIGAMLTLSSQLFVYFTPAQAATAAQIRLTPLAGASVNTCIWSLDQSRTKIIWAGDVRGNGFRMGINGRTYIFSLNEFTYDPTTGANILRTRDRKIFVRATPAGSISRRDYDLDIMSISVAMNGANATFTGYRSCPPGD